MSASLTSTGLVAVNMNAKVAVELPGHARMKHCGQNNDA